jgi:hypothetical protein
MRDLFLRRAAAASLMLAALHPVQALAQSTEPAAAVQTLVEQVPDLLRSDDYKQIACFAGQYRVAAAIPLLHRVEAPIVMIAIM